MRATVAIGRAVRASPSARRETIRYASSLDGFKRERKRRSERIDYVDELTLLDREAHKQAMATALADHIVVEQIERLRLGKFKNSTNQKHVGDRRKRVAAQMSASVRRLGKTGVGMHTSWEQMNREALPEVVLLGHSNCGKSALLNALAGQAVRKGAAAVSPRAGWTAELNFYLMQPGQPKRAHRAASVASGAAAGAASSGGSQATGLVLVDTPGYGFTVGSPEQLRQWGLLLTDYLHYAPQLRLALLLVDCTRGVCEADRTVLRRLRRASVPTLVALTKADLLRPAELAASHAVVRTQLEQAAAASHSRGVHRAERAAADATAKRIVQPAPEAATDAPVGVGVADAADVAALKVRSPLMLSAHMYTGVDELWRTLQTELLGLKPRGARRDVRARVGSIEAAAETRRVARQHTSFRDIDDD